MTVPAWDPSDPCVTCIERAVIEGDIGVTMADPFPPGECPASRYECGHHDNCLWVADVCHWCGVEIIEGPDGDGVLGPIP